jgi:two-component system OmpR family response regulator
MKTAIHSADPIVKTNHNEFSVFVVDDDESFLFALAFHLKKDTGWKVYCYPSVEECLCHLHLNPGAIVLDYFFDQAGVNNIDGMTALKLIKSLNPEIPVIMISSQDDIKVSMELLRAGAFTYIIKDRETLPAIEKTLLSLRSVLISNRPKRKNSRNSD